MFIRMWVWYCGTQYSIVLAKQNGLRISPIIHSALTNELYCLQEKIASYDSHKF